jgi:peptide-methionine (S)-S-oxide reductase
VLRRSEHRQPSGPDLRRSKDIVTGQRDRCPGRRLFLGHAIGDNVSDGDTGHAESVKVTFDPSVISYGQLLKVYFGVAHDPTELNRQGPDTGSQYRSEIFYTTPQQQKIAQSYIAQLNTAKVFDGAIVTQVQPLKAFYTAEAYHQDYARRAVYRL